MRKLASVQIIENIRPIAGADFIEVADVQGWQVVVGKGQFQPGEKVVYIEIDSWVPADLHQTKTPTEFKGVVGERLRTVKLRGQISQGLVLPISVLEGDYDVGTDVSAELNIHKWELPESSHSDAVGSFPSYLNKTDQERVQNVLESKFFMKHPEINTWTVEEKLEGMSCTLAVKDHEWVLCSRNLQIKLEGSAFAQATESIRTAEMLQALEGFALQGEVIGPGIQNNIYGLTFPEFRCFNVFNIKEARNLKPAERKAFLAGLPVKVLEVPTLETNFKFEGIKQMLEYAEGISQLKNVQREGVVLKNNIIDFSFKAISNAYLLKQK